MMAKAKQKTSLCALTANRSRLRRQCRHILAPTDMRLWKATFRRSSPAALWAAAPFQGALIHRNGILFRHTRRSRPAAHA